MVISAIAAFIASQALITGMFSIVKQAIALGFCPRFEVKFTSREAEGQVYIPAINWAMFLGCVAITLVFRTAGNLAAAYGIAVTGTMGITTLAFGYVAHYRWGWRLWQGAGRLRADPGGRPAVLRQQPAEVHSTAATIPVAIAAVLVTIMLTWQWGRAAARQGVLRLRRPGREEGRAGSSPSATRSTRSGSRSRRTCRWRGPSCRGGAGWSRPTAPSSSSAPGRSATSTSTSRCRSAIFLKKYGVLPAHVTLFHVNQLTVAEAERGTPVRGDRPRPEHRLRRRDLRLHGAARHPRGPPRAPGARARSTSPPSAGSSRSGRKRSSSATTSRSCDGCGSSLFRLILRLSTPAHKFFGLGYDAGVSKEIIPVVFSRSRGEGHPARAGDHRELGSAEGGRGVTVAGALAGSADTWRGGMPWRLARTGDSRLPSP